jgi:hypothetical protein
MTKPEEILIEAIRRRVRLTPQGDRLCAECVGQLDPLFERTLIQQKSKIIKLLTSLQWTAKTILDGAFDPLEIDGTFACMDGRMYSDLYDQMASNVLDPTCRAALQHLHRAGQKTPPPNPLKTQKR